jgi:hypothetical protein
MHVAANCNDLTPISYRAQIRGGCKIQVLVWGAHKFPSPRNDSSQIGRYARGVRPDHNKSREMIITEADAPLIRGMILRGDPYHHIAAYFAENQGRIGEVANGMKSPSAVKKGAKRRWPDSRTAEPHELPPPGPYFQNFRDGKDIITDAHEALVEVMAFYMAHHDTPEARDIQRRFHSAIAERKRELWGQRK